MQRISFIFIFASTFLSGNAQTVLPAKPNRMEERILELGTYGKNPQGGVSRLAFSEADKKGRVYIMGLMKNAGLQVRVDAAANIIGRRAGKNSYLPAIAFGSHIDSVPFGGNYDGDVGVIGALECIELLNESKIQTEHPLEVIVFTNEEGGLTGSTAMIKKLDVFNLHEVSNSGKPVYQGLQELGGDTSKLNTAVRSKDELLAFLELHIEQGGILDKSNLQIGVVEGIVGIEQWDVTVQGRANHAGTTPMALRQDAMLSAAKFTIAVNEIVRSMAGAQVGTVGRIKAEPGAPNVIPGRVVLSLELRDLSREKIFSVFERIRLRTLEIDRDCGTTTSFRSINSNQPAITDKHIQDIIATQSKALRLSYKSMPSGAGHDSQDMARIVPTGMIFVPSKDGISHAPDEYTTPQAMANGANVLLHSILALDKGK